MIVGQGNYVYKGGKGFILKTSSRKPKVWIIRKSSSASGCIDIRGIRFPKHCIGKRVRVKVEFVDEPNMVLDKNNNVVEIVKWDGE